MTTEAVILVLIAALLHASWNAFVKAATDRLVILGLIATSHVFVGVFLVFQSPLPDIASVPYIVASTIIHFGYYYLLYHSYRLGDLSQVYPIARGMAPILVAVGAQLFAGEALVPLAWAGVLIASAGIFMLSGNIFNGKISPHAILAAMATGLMIGLYSIADGLGVRIANSSLGYIGWLFAAEILVVGFVFSKIRHRLKQITKQTLLLGLFGGLISAMAYGIVIYVKASAPLGIVSTFRETSVVFASLIGILWLGERPWKLRIGASIVVVGGVIVMGFATL